MKQNKRGMVLPGFLPMALSADLCPLLDFEESCLAFSQARKLTPPERGGDRHQMRIAEPPVRNELFHAFHGKDSPRPTQAACPIASRCGSLISAEVQPRIVSSIMKVFSNT